LFACSCPFDSLSLGLLNRTIYKKILDWRWSVFSLNLASFFESRTWFLAVGLIWGFLF
jgi:hypothetical protein